MRKMMMILMLGLVGLAGCAGGAETCRVISYYTHFQEICSRVGKYGEDCTTYPVVTPIYDCQPLPTETPKP